MGQDDLDTGRGTVTSLRKGAPPALHSLGGGDRAHDGGGGHPFVISVEETPSQGNLQTPVKTTVLEDNLSSRSDSPAEEIRGQEKTKASRGFFSFLPLLRPRRARKAKAVRDSGAPLPLTSILHVPRLRALPDSDNVNQSSLENFELFQVINKSASKKKGDLASLHSFAPVTPRLPRLQEHVIEEDLNTLSSLYTILNAQEKDKVAGDFTSITFEIEDVENDNPEEDLSRPNTQTNVLHRHDHRPRQNEGWKSSAGTGAVPFLSAAPPGHGLPLPPIENRRLTVGGDVLLPDNLEHWMRNLPLELQKVPLNHLFIPGSHDSFSYSLTPEEELGPDAPGLVSALNSCCPCLARPAILRWSVTQRATTTQQLKHGVRYFDIRVAVRNGRFYFVHGLFGDDLEPLLSEIRHFLVKHPGEVVFLDFQHLHGLANTDHASLVTLLRNTFSELICPFFHQLNHLSLAYLARFKYQVLVFYRHQETMQAIPWLWSGSSLPNPWPNSTSVAAMFSFLEAQIQERNPDAFFVTQCVLTPSGRYLARHFSGQLESMAAPCNKALPDWLAQLPVGVRGPNIVMTDFVEHDEWAVPRAVVRRNAFNDLLPSRPVRF